MALGTYSGLQAAIAGWLHRADLTTQIVDFITLAEARIARKLRYNISTAAISITSQTTTLATAIGTSKTISELRSIVLSTGNPSLDTPIRIVTPEVLADVRAIEGNQTGRPRWGAIYGGVLDVTPAPDTTYTANLIFFDGLTPLSTTNTTNEQLAIAPDAYLYGALLEAEGFLENDERVPIWKDRFEEGINDLHIWRDNQEFGASLRPGRLPRVFG